MTTDDFKRKLTAILSADVEGYSLLMRDDEEATIRILTTYRKAATKLIQQYRGRLIDATGDNFLSEFTSVVDAVNCAVEIQRELAKRNAELPDNRRMQFRIGINLGDVVEDEGRIYGDGVNIAARMEGLAEGGGICISGTVYDAIENKVGLEYEYLGEQDVKNIPKPIRAYRVLSYPGAAAHRVVKAKKAVGKTWRNVLLAVAAVLVVGGGVAIWNFYLRPTPPVEVASVEKMAYPLPDKPSIAVLAFDNLSGDPEQEYLSDGIAEEIITALSKTDRLFVIARNSTFTYKEKPVKVQQVSEELGVRYVLEGSVKKSGDQVRITAQLIDAVQGQHLWAEHYDRDLKDIFAIQDDITLKILTELQVKLTEGEQARVWGKRFPNIDVYLKTMEALSLWRKGTKESLIRHGQIGQELIEIAPEYAVGYITLAWNYWDRALNGISPRESIAKAFELAQKAIALDEFAASSHTILSNVYLLMRQYEKAISEGRLAVSLNPNGAMDNGLLGSTLCYAGRIDEGIDQLKQGIRLNPFPAYWYYLHLGRCYRQKGQYEEALTEFKKAVDRSPDALYNHLNLSAGYILLGREEEARAEATKVLELDPNFSVERASKAWPFKNQADLKLYVDALNKAGLK